MNKSLKFTKEHVELIGARELFNSNSISIFKLIERSDLIWICTTPEMQLKILNTLKNYTEGKIIIEKPVGSNQNINKEILDLFSNQENLFISRPWSFSEIWNKFSANFASNEVITNIKIVHSGEIIRKYLNPPQDWLHHDICFIHEIKKYLNLNFTKLSKLWSNENQSLTLKSLEELKIEIIGGFSPNRVSIFEVSYKSGMKINMDINNRSYLVQDSDGLTNNFEFMNDLPINSMVDHILNLETDHPVKNIELPLLKELQILAV